MYWLAPYLIFQIQSSSFQIRMTLVLFFDTWYNKFLWYCLKFLACYFNIDTIVTTIYSASIECQTLCSNMYICISHLNNDTAIQGNTFQAIFQDSEVKQFTLIVNIQSQDSSPDWDEFKLLSRLYSLHVLTSSCISRLNYNLFHFTHPKLWANIFLCTHIYLPHSHLSFAHSVSLWNALATEF